MKTYEIFVRGVTTRVVLVEAENQEAAEIEAMQEFSLLVGASVHSAMHGTEGVEVVSVEELSDQAPPELREAVNKLGSLSDLI